MKNQFPYVARAIGCLVAGCLWSQLAGAVFAQGDARPSKPAKSTGDAAAGVFNSDQVFRIEIEIAEPDMEVLRGYRWGGRGGDAQERPSVRATVREGDRVYRDVALHLKGSAGSFRPIHDKPGLTLNFGKHTKGQSFRGLERFSLNNSVQDPSYLNEQISRELFAAADVPVPRATHAQVILNQRNLGLYVLVEAYNKQFLRRSFTNDSGHLYDGGFVRDVTDTLAVSSGSNPDDRSDLNQLVAAARDRDLSNRLARLEKILDVDRFLSLLAMDVVTCNSDGYAMNRNNYRIYHDPGSDRLVFMPHGLDQMFGTFRCDPSLSILLRPQGLVAQAVWETPEGRRRYLKRLSELVSRHFNVEALTNRVDQLAAKIRPALTELATPSARDAATSAITERIRPGVTERRKRRVANFDQEVGFLKQRIVERAESLREQLATPRETLAFDNSGIARLDGWKTSADFGQPVLRETAGKEVPLTLHIGAPQGSAVGAWTTKVTLEAGKYRFEGKLRCQDVVPEPGDRRGGAGLRTSSQRMTQKATGDTTWTETAFEFEVFEAMSEVELRCELRAIRGQVWFDRQSLRLRRE